MKKLQITSNGVIEVYSGTEARSAEVRPGDADAKF